MRDFAFGVSAKQLSDFITFFDFAFLILKVGVCLLSMEGGRVVIHTYTIVDLFWAHHGDARLDT